MKDLSAPQLTAIIANLAELHEWELANAPLLCTLTGRHLYFRIAQRVVGERELLSRSLKELVGGLGYTDKALRTRMREMEQAGLIASMPGRDDARARSLMPTDVVLPELMPKIGIWDFCFHDANHLSLLMTRDFNNIKEFSHIGSFIIFDNLGM